MDEVLHLAPVDLGIVIFEAYGRFLEQLSIVFKEILDQTGEVLSIGHSHLLLVHVVSFLEEKLHLSEVDMVHIVHNQLLKLRLQGFLPCAFLSAENFFLQLLHDLYQLKGCLKAIPDVLHSFDSDYLGSVDGL